MPLFFNKEIQGDRIVFTPNKKRGSAFCIAIVATFFIGLFFAIYKNSFLPIAIPLLLFVFSPSIILRIDRMLEISLDANEKANQSILKSLTYHSDYISSRIVNALLTGKPIIINTPIEQKEHP